MNEVDGWMNEVHEWSWWMKLMNELMNEWSEVDEWMNEWGWYMYEE